jgi:hypothetical protein
MRKTHKARGLPALVLLCPPVRHPASFLQIILGMHVVSARAGLAGFTHEKPYDRNGSEIQHADCSPARLSSCLRLHM